MKFPLLPFRLRAAVMASGLATGALLAIQAPASADSTISVPVMGQQDPQWAGAPLGTSPTDTVGSAGCAITSVTMLLRYYGMNTDPGAFNSWLTGNGGYAYDDGLIWTAVDAYTNGRVTFTSWTGANLNLITAELDAGRPVVAEVSLYGNQHFVLITGYSTEGGFVINDPWFNDSVNLSDRYGDPSVWILSIRTFAPADPGGPSARGRLSWFANTEAAGHLAQ